MIGWRNLPPLGRVVAAVTVLCAVLIGVALFSSAWDGLTAWLPWSEARRLERAEARLDQLQTDLDARTAEVLALQRQAERTTVVHHTLTEARAVTARATALSETAPDADIQIDPARADRLRDADRRLCELSPDLCPAPGD